MAAERLTGLRWAAGVIALVIGVAVFSVAYFQDDIQRAALDPQQPFQTYHPPPPPDYSKPAAWLAQGDPAAGAAPATIFYVGPTSFLGGRNWLGTVPGAGEQQRRDLAALANYAGPFADLGPVFAPHFRQASFFAYGLTRHDDGRDARRFAYQDVRRAFAQFLSTHPGPRPLVLVGVEQGGQALERLLQDLADHPEVLQRLAAVYLIEVIAPEADFGQNGLPPLCTARAQAHCTVIYRSLTNASPPRERILGRALVWSRDGQLEELGDNKPACVNPLSGVRDDADLSPEHNLGAAKLSNLTEATQPSLQPGLVGASCEAGLLRVSTPSSAGFQVQGEGVSRLTIPGFNLFFGDLRADARARLSTWYGRPLAGPIGSSCDLAPAPIHAIP